MTPLAADLCVIGGGPAGAAAAIAAARRGTRVALLDVATSPRNPGETLPPAARGLLRELGVWAALSGGIHRPAFANESAWGGSAVARTDFTRDPNGHGWHVDRASLDASLLAAAGKCGAVVLNQRLRTIERARGRWRLVAFDDRGERTIVAPWVIDATGRRRVMAARAGVPQVRTDSLVAVTATVAPRDPQCASDLDSVTFVEAVPDGWWFTAAVPRGDRVLAYFTDYRDESARAAATPAGFRSLWAAAPHVSGRVEPSRWHVTRLPRVRTAGSTRLGSCGGGGWLAAGDALMTFDPISSHGVMSAIYTGWQAAEAVASNAAATHVFSQYEEIAARHYAAYLHARRACYRREARWRDRPFWRFRH